MTGVVNSQLLMPGSIPSDFAAQFARLATATCALPIDINGMARIGAAAQGRAYRVPAGRPLIEIDGSRKPNPEKPAGQRTRGFETDHGLLNDLLDMHPTTFIREFNLSSADLVWACKGGPLCECATMREILASKEASARALIYFAAPFNQFVARFSATSTRYLEMFLGKAKPDSGRPSRVPPPPERPSVEKSSFVEFAMQRFLKGALLARSGTDPQLIKAEKLFTESAQLFAKTDRFSAAAMMTELSREIQMSEGRPHEKTRRSEATYWLEALQLLRDPSFELLYYNALNAAQGEPAGSDTLRRIFRSSMGYFRDAGDGEELTRSLIRHAWTKLMKAENPASPLNGLDWLNVRDDLTVVSDRLAGGGHADLAKTAFNLEQMALGFADEITITEKKRISDAP